MEMHEVKYFLAVADLLNFTRAAEHCNVAQPSLTRAIKKLENELGGPLFHRERQNTHLTELGRMMLPHLRSTYEAAQSARELARSVRSGETTPLRVGIGNAVAFSSLASLFADLRQSINGLELTVRQGPEPEICERLLAGEHDIAFIGEQSAMPDRVRAWQLYRERGLIALPIDHRLADRPMITPEEIENEAFISLAGIADRDRLVQAFGDHAPRVQHSSHSHAELLALVEQGFGLGVMPSHAPTPAGVTCRPLEDGRLEKAIVVAIVAGRPFNRATDICIRLTRARSWLLDGPAALETTRESAPIPERPR